MNPDDLPPREHDGDTDLAGELGRSFAMIVGIGIFLALAGIALFFVMRWTGHRPW